MVVACAKQIAQHIAPLHFVLPVPVLYLAKGAPGPSTQARIITVQDTLDDPQALGYHTQDGSEHIWGVVGTQAAMSNGAQPLTGKYAISTIQTVTPSSRRWSLSSVAGKSLGLEGAVAVEAGASLAPRRERAGDRRRRVVVVRGRGGDASTVQSLTHPVALRPDTAARLHNLRTRDCVDGCPDQCSA
jgi:hypothetical protein